MTKNRLAILGVFTVAVGFIFQNCGKAGFDSALDNNITQFSSEGTSAPFAFDILFDQITYMSCNSSVNDNNPGFFTLKAGSYSPRAGLRVRPDFANYARTQLRPVYPDVEVTAKQVKTLIAESPENLGATPNIALRHRFDLTGAIGNQNGATGLDLVSFLGPLSSDAYMATFLNDAMFASTGNAQAPIIRYFPLGPSNDNSGRRVEAALRYPMNEANAVVIRHALGQSAGHAESLVLALTYSPGQGVADPGAIRAPAGTTDPKLGYGVGYRFEFGHPSNSNIANPANVISNIVEYNLEDTNQTPNIANRWDCSRKYKILRREDVVPAITTPPTPSLCPSFDTARLIPAATDTTAILADKQRWRKELEIAYNHLNAEYWEVNPEQHCMFPKQSGVSCYDENIITPFPGIQYDIAQPCYHQIDDNSSGQPLPAAMAAAPICPQYATICVRPTQ